MLPLISVVMPTCNRRAFIPDAIKCYQSQTYPNKELIVVDNGDDSIEDLIPSGVVYEHIGIKKRTTGEMRNLACAKAKGKIICHFDDDDHSHPLRIAEQYKLMTAMCVSLTGYNTMFFIDETRQLAWIYRNPELYALGTSLMYTRDYWRGGKFPDKDVAEDTAFIERAQWRRALAVCDARDRIVARIHPENTCKKEKYMLPPMWTPVTYDSVHRMII